MALFLFRFFLSFTSVTNLVHCKLRCNPIICRGLYACTITDICFMNICLSILFLFPRFCYCDIVKTLLSWIHTATPKFAYCLRDEKKTFSVPFPPREASTNALAGKRIIPEVRPRTKMTSRNDKDDLSE